MPGNDKLEISQENDNVLEGLVNVLIQKAKIGVLFGNDIQWITQITSALDQKKPIGWTKIKSLFKNKELSDFKKQLKKSIENNVGRAVCDPEKLEENKETIIEEFKKIIEDKFRERMPDKDNWFTGKSGSDTMFPKSNTGIILGKDEKPILSANCHDNITCSVGPKTNEEEEALFEAVWKKKPTALFTLGIFFPHKNSDFSSYYNGGTYKNLTVKSAQQNTSYKTLHIYITPKKGEELKEEDILKVRVYNLAIADQTPFYLNYESALELQSRLRDVNPQKSTGGVWIHCASGVGRTGQMRLIIELLHELKSKPKLRSLVDSFIFDKHLTLEDYKDRESVYDDSGKQISDALDLVRIIRYAIQVEKQYDAAIQQAILLHASQHGANQQQYEHLATRMGIKKDELRAWNRNINPFEDSPLVKPDENKELYPIRCHNSSTVENISQSLANTLETLKKDLNTLEEGQFKTILKRAFQDLFEPQVSKLQTLLKPLKPAKSQSSSSLTSGMENLKNKAKRLSTFFKPEKYDDSADDTNPASTLFNSNTLFFDLFYACESLLACTSKYKGEEIEKFKKGVEKIKDELIELRNQLNQSFQKPKANSPMNPNQNENIPVKPTSTLDKFKQLKPSKRTSVLIEQSETQEPPKSPTLN